MDIARISVTPTIATANYVATDTVGGVMSFAVGANVGRVIGANLTVRTPAAVNVLELWLFAASPTITSADNAPIDITDANLEAAKPIGVITFAAANYYATAAGAFGQGTWAPTGAMSLPFVTSGTIYGQLVMRTATAQYGSTTDLVVSLIVDKLAAF